MQGAGIEPARYRYCVFIRRPDNYRHIALTSMFDVDDKSTFAHSIARVGLSRLSSLSLVGAAFSSNGGQDLNLI